MHNKCNALESSPTIPPPGSLEPQGLGAPGSTVQAHSPLPASAHYRTGLLLLQGELILDGGKSHLSCPRINVLLIHWPEDASDGVSSERMWEGMSPAVQWVQ